MCVCVCERSLVEWVPVAGLDGKWSPALFAGGVSLPCEILQLPECCLDGGGMGRRRRREGASMRGRD